MSNATGYSGVAARLNGVNQVIQSETALNGNVNYIVLEFRPASTSEPIFQFDAGKDLTLNGASSITTNGLGTVTPTFQKGTIYEASKWVRVRYDFSSPVAITAFTAGLVGAAYGEVDFSYIECDLFTLELFDGGKFLQDSAGNFDARFSFNGIWVTGLSGKENGESHNGISQFNDHNCKKYWEFNGVDDNEYLKDTGSVRLQDGQSVTIECIVGNGFTFLLGAGGAHEVLINASGLFVEIAGSNYSETTNPIVGYNVAVIEKISATQYELTLNGVTKTINESTGLNIRDIGSSGATYARMLVSRFEYGNLGNNTYANKFVNIASLASRGKNIPFANVPENLNSLGQDIVAQTLTQKITDGSNNQDYWQYLPCIDQIESDGVPRQYDIINGQYIDYGKAFSESEFTLMFVISGDALATETSKILFDARDADNDGLRVWLNASGYPELQYNTQDLNKGSVVANGAQLWTVIADATDLYFRIDGVQVATAAKSGGSISTTVNAILGTESFGTKTNFWTGLIAEFFPVQSALSGTTLTDKENELMTKYGI